MSQDYLMNFTSRDMQRYSAVDIFSTQGRIGQKRYFVYSVVIPFIIFCAIAPIAGLATYLPIASSAIFYSVLAIAFIAMQLAVVRLTIQRCHDFNRSGTLAILAFIPLANIVFALIPATNGLNQYGEVPVPANRLFKTCFYLILALIIIATTFIIIDLANGSLLKGLITL